MRRKIESQWRCMRAVFGNPGAMCMAAAIMISTFGCNNGLILAGARVYYAMARDRLFFRRVATTNAQHVPAAALVAQGIWTVFLTLPRTQVTNASDRGSQLRKCLYSTARVHRFGRPAVLFLARRGSHCSPEKISLCRAAVSHLGLSDRADRVDAAGRSFDYRSCLAGAGNFWNRDRDCPDGFARLRRVAEEKRKLKICEPIVRGNCSVRCPQRILFVVSGRTALRRAQAATLCRVTGATLRGRPNRRTLNRKTLAAGTMGHGIGIGDLESTLL